MKLQLQQHPEVLRYSGSLAAGASSLSGSWIGSGYGVVRGLIYSSASLESASGLRVQQSTDTGLTWDYVSSSDMAASGTSIWQYTLYGNAVRVILKMGITASGTVRTLWQNIPIP